jgi:hypothetical protein
MAWRIHDNVIRGEVDNRERGRVRGRLWLKGLTSPVLLDLKGNAAPDIAGCLLAFQNPAEPTPMHPDARLARIQRGSAGDITASRKVRVFDLPVAEAYLRLKKKLPVPEHMANCLYLEWYSEANGRVVVESTDYKLTISPPRWKPSDVEEQQRQQESAEGFTGFIQKLSDALDSKKHHPPEDKDWDEFDYEKLMRECDARTDKYGELLDKYMDHPDRDRIIAREMGWTWLEEALDAQEGKAGTTPDGEDLGASDFEQADSAASDKAPEREHDDAPFDYPRDAAEPPLNPATEGIDWVRGEDGYVAHPLSLRALDGSEALYRQFEELGLDALDDEDLRTLYNEYQTTGAKLAGALDGLAYGRDLNEGPFVVACLKRALNYLHKAQAALEKLAPKRLLPPDTIISLRSELFALREEILRLMREFRTQS